MRDRSIALDAFRGATVALMILVNNPGSWSHLYPPLAHAQWHGCTPTDLVFPFFLFAVGNALALSPPDGARIARRTLLIFAIGLFLNAFPFVRWDAAGELVAKDFGTLRWMGVLQRIALCFGAAALIVRFGGDRAARVATVLLLLGYWAACAWVGAPGDPYSLEGFFGTSLDRALLGPAHLYRGEGVPFDPEGLASTLPAIAQVLLGFAVGRALTAGRITHETLVRLFVTAVGLGVVAYWWQLSLPLNKKIWTPSYVLLTTSLAMLTLAALVARIDLAGRRGAGVGFCTVFGKNALFVFVMSGLIPRALALLHWVDDVDAQGQPRFTTPLPWLYEHVFAGIGGDPRFGSLLFALANLAFYWALAAWLDRRRIYIRV
ncbi:MAG: DUF1624 domain-containing protein [Burkholderiales bacterium]|nr:DUF1624 domain-containing protein [Burkholderiales bacterium]